MGRHSDSLVSLLRTSGAGAVISARSHRSRIALPAFSFTVSLAMILLTVIAPDTPALAAGRPVAAEPSSIQSQQLGHSGPGIATIVRDNYGATSAPKGPSARSAGVPDPGTAKAIAYEMLKAKGWGDNEYSCLVELWERESHWNASANNPYSGAYGIPQALPGSKMASAGEDWQTNPATQITWGIGYIEGRYGTPCGAWDFFGSHNWY